MSGIAITLAEVLENNNEFSEAYEVYRSALELYKSSSQNVPSAGPSKSISASPTDLRDRMRAVALASKLGVLAQSLHKPPEDEEKWLTYAVNELLKTLLIVKENPSTTLWDVMRGHGSKDAASMPKDNDTELVLAELSLPRWVTKTDVSAPLEALGTFYAEHDKIEFVTRPCQRGGHVLTFVCHRYAYPLYLHAASLLTGPVARSPSTGRIVAATSVTTIPDLCRGAQLLSNIADLTLKYDRGQASAAALAHAKDTTADAIALMKQGIAQATGLTGKVHYEQCDICESALVAALHNMGALAEVSMVAFSLSVA
jgi:hypothetical protein